SRRLGNEADQVIAGERGLPSRRGGCVHAGLEEISLGVDRFTALVIKDHDMIGGRACLGESLDLVADSLELLEHVSAAGAVTDLGTVDVHAFKSRRQYLQELFVQPLRIRLAQTHE